MRDHLERDNFNIAIRSKIGQDNGVTISYAKNLKTIKATENWEDVVTKILPVGKDGLLLPEIYLSVADKLYDIPYTKVIEIDQSDVVEDDYKDSGGEVNQDDYERALINDLRKKGLNYLEENKFPKVNYTVEAYIKNVSDIGDTIYVKHPKCNIDLMTNVIAIEYDCILERYTKIEFGNFKNSLKNLFKDITSTIKSETTKSANNTKNLLEEELKKATADIWATLGNSYVIYDGDKILVVDKLPKEEAKNVIMINSGGIGFSSTGIDGIFNSAWSIDGTLNMQNINVINLVADMIKGGTLRLGGYDNTSGILEVYDAEGNIIGKIDNNGITFIIDGNTTTMGDIINNVLQNTENISKLEIDIDGLRSLISSITDLTIKGESTNASALLKNVAKGYIFKLEIHPYKNRELENYPCDILYPSNDTFSTESLGNSNIVTQTYPNSNIYPGNNVFMRNKANILSITNITTQKVINYEIPTDLYYLDDNTYDELVYEYGNDKCIVRRRVGFNNGVAYELEDTIIEEYDFPLVETEIGDYLIELVDYKQAYIYCEMLGKNDITDIFATKIELRSSIEQTNSKIETEVKEVTTLMDTELSNLDSKITQTAEQISSEVSNVQKDLNGEISNLDSKVTQTAEELTSEINKKIGSEEAQSLIKQTADSLTSEINKKVDTTTFNSTIRQTTESIEAKVSKGDIGSYIEQYYNRVLIGFNNASNYIQLDTSGINIYNGSITSSRLRMKLDQNGLQLYNDDYNVGLIGTNYYSEDSSQKGLSFDLNYGGSYMGWFQRQSVSSNYLALMYYARAGKFGQSNEGIHFSTNVYGHNWSLSGFNMAASIANEYETINDKSIKVVTDVSIDDKGQINVTKEFINVRNGMITAVPNSAADLS